MLLLHGGTETSTVPASRFGLAALRMLPVAWSVLRAGRGRVTVLRLVDSVRGWNGTEQSPVADARWALQQVRRRFPGLPVVVVGHSMGGRAALHVADDPSTVLVIGMAPWVTPTEPASLVAGQRLVVVHGSDDAMTSPAASEALVRAAQGVATAATLVQVPGHGHVLLDLRLSVDRLVAELAVHATTGREPRGALARRVLSPGAVVLAAGSS